MKQQEIIDFKLVPALKECALHQVRMNSAWHLADVADARLSAISGNEIRFTE